MQRFGQDVFNQSTFYLTAQLAGQSLGPQVVAITPPKVVSTMSAENSREHVLNSDSEYGTAYGDMKNNSGAEVAAPD